MNEKNIKTTENGWLGRSLDNYKQMHRKSAESRGNLKEFLAATTLTQARKLAFGMKRGNTK